MAALKFERRRFIRWEKDCLRFIFMAKFRTNDGRLPRINCEILPICWCANPSASISHAARTEKADQNHDYKNCCGFMRHVRIRGLDVYRTLVVPEIGWAFYFASPSRRMSSADQPDSLPGT
jgi:hypothetical protein